MAKRLQVILKDPEYREIQRAARSRAAARHDYPSGDIDSMLSEIESGYGAGTQP